MNLKIISAGAGSGKTYRLTQEMVGLLKGGVRASGIIATTFTNKAAAELQERVRVKLLEEGLTDAANQLTNALIGTVHSLGVKLLRRFAFEAGVSPEIDIIADEDQQLLFNLSLANILTNDRVLMMEGLRDRLGLTKNDYYDWRKEVKFLTDTARANDFSIEVLEQSKLRSFQEFQVFLGPVADRKAADFSRQLQTLLEETVEALHNNEDSTKVTASAEADLRQFLERLRRGQELYWHEWVKISKTKVGAKSKEAIADLTEFAASHDQHPQFHQDIKTFIEGIFDISIEALKEYEQYKKQRGLIDYIDMEIQVKRLLDQDAVKAILEEELDLLMVDEFQDTNPIQLEIFLKLSKIAQHSIWVGDPKQSIYGFRGADPRLMQVIIEKTGGIKPEDIQVNSWRSREDLVFASNALFTKAFPQLPPQQVALIPKRKKLASADAANKENEPIAMGDALVHWHFTFDGEGRQPGKPWMENCIADSIRRFLATDKLILDKATGSYRVARPGDVAVLCRSNAECATVAEALHRSGLKAAISRTGLLDKAEMKLILACLKFILNPKDSLSVAEILLLASGQKIEDIIDDRLEFLDREHSFGRENAWAGKDDFIRRLHDLRTEVTELSSAELLNLLMEELDLRRIIASWGKVSQRLDNVDVLRRLALQYEANCNRLHSAASLGGLLLWLNDLSTNEKDEQGSGEGPDAVNVLTYHRSKGLEWPVVICHSLEGKLRDRIWGVDIIPETEEVDLDNLLGNRWLRYWINPYANQIQNTPLEERLNASEAKKRATQLAQEEDARLLYVGLTRARDYLIFPTRDQPTRWLNRIWQEGNEDFPTLDPNTSETPWDWGGQVLHADTETFPYPREFSYAEPVVENIDFLEQRSGKRGFAEFFIDVDKESIRKDFRSKKETHFSYGPALETSAEADLYQVAKAAKAWLTADQEALGKAMRTEMAEALLTRYEVNEMVELHQVLAWSEQYFDYLQKTFSPKRALRKYPIELRHGDRLFATTIDLILETGDGLVLVQNSSFSGNNQKNQIKKAKELRAWLHLSKLALQQIFGQQKVHTLVHFVLDSALVEVTTEAVAVQQKLF